MQQEKSKKNRCNEDRWYWYMWNNWRGTQKRQVWQNFDTGLISECEYNEDSNDNEEESSGESNNEEGNELLQSLMVVIF